MKKLEALKITGILISVSLFYSCSSASKRALEDFVSGEFKVLVCPVHILNNHQSFYDTISSLKIADYINENKHAKASVTDLVPAAYNTWERNEAKMLTASIDLFVEYVKSLDLPDDTYLFYPEFLKGGQNSEIRAVHYCLLNNEGDIAMRGLINSKWEVFQSVNPITNDDCVTVLINGFENKLKNK